MASLCLSRLAQFREKSGKISSSSRRLVSSFPVDLLPEKAVSNGSFYATFTSRMSGFLQALVNGDDSCGPVNPVSQLAKGLQGEGSQLGRVSQELRSPSILLYSQIDTTGPLHSSSRPFRLLSQLPVAYAPAERGRSRCSCKSLFRSAACPAWRLAICDGWPAKKPSSSSAGLGYRFHAAFTEQLPSSSCAYE